MAVERESLQGLTKTAEKLYSAISQVESTSINLGGVAGPARLNYTVVTGVERIGRIAKIVEIRDQIATKTIPYLQHRQEKVAEQQIRISTTLDEYASLLEKYSSRLKPEELELVRAEYRSLVGSIPAGLTKPPAYTRIFQRVEEEVPATPVVLEQPKLSEASDLEATIAEIQRLANKEILTDQNQLARAQEAARQFGGTIEFKTPLGSRRSGIEVTERETIRLRVGFQGDERPVGAIVLPDGEYAYGLTGFEEKIFNLLKDVYQRGELKNISRTDLIRSIWGEDVDIRLVVGTGRLTTMLGTLKHKLSPSWTVVNDIPRGSSRKEALYRLAKVVEDTEELASFRTQEVERLQPEEPEGQDLEEVARLKAEAKRRNRENREIALNIIFDSVLASTRELTPQEILDLFGTQSDGKRFNWSSVKSSMIAYLLGAEGRLKRYTASEKDRELKSKLYRFMEASEDQDFHEVIKEFEPRLIAWLKGEGPLTNKEESAELVTGLEAEQTSAWQPETSLPAPRKPRLYQRPTQGTMNSREFGHWLKLLGFSLGNGGGDMKILDPNKQYVWSISSSRAGGKELAGGTYRTALKKVEERMRELGLIGQADQENQ